MTDLSQDANFLLYEIKGKLKNANQTGFYVIEEIQSIAFGSMLGPSNTIPPANAATGKEMQKLRKRMMLALNELTKKKHILFHGYIEGRKTYVMNPNMPDQSQQIKEVQRAKSRPDTYALPNTSKPLNHKNNKSPATSRDGACVTNLHRQAVPLSRIGPPYAQRRISAQLQAKASHRKMWWLVPFCPAWPHRDKLQHAILPNCKNVRSRFAAQ